MNHFIEPISEDLQSRYREKAVEAQSLLLLAAAAAVEASGERDKPSNR